MARKKSKLNFLDSLLGGLAQGFQLGQQFKGDKQKSELAERKFGLQEQQLSFNERQLLIQEQQAEAAQEKTKRTLDFISQFLPGLGQQPAQAPVPQQPAPASTAQTRTQAITQPAPVTPPIQEATELPIGGPVTPPLAGRANIGGPSLRPAADQIQDTTDFGLQQLDVGLETTPLQDVSSEFPLFDAELQRIRQLQGLPSDLRVSGKGVGIPVEFSVVPDEKKVLTLLKRQFIEDQRGRGIKKFDILTFRGLLKDRGIGITDDFRKELEDEFKKQFREGTSGRALAHFKVGERGVRKAEFLRDLGAKFGLIPERFEKEADLALAGDRIKVNVKLGNDAESGRPISQVGFALKDDPTDIIFIGEPTIAGAGTQINIRNLPQIPTIMLKAITESRITLRSVARIEEIITRVGQADFSSFVGPLDAPLATLMEKLGFPNKDQQAIGNITTDLTDALARLRSGGVIGQEEWVTFMELVPQRNDPAPTFINKLELFKQKMKDIESVNQETARDFGFFGGNPATRDFKSMTDEQLKALGAK